MKDGFNEGFILGFLVGAIISTIAASLILSKIDDGFIEKECSKHPEYEFCQEVKTYKLKEGY